MTTAWNSIGEVYWFYKSMEKSRITLPKLPFPLDRRQVAELLETEAIHAQQPKNPDSWRKLVGFYSVRSPEARRVLRRS